MEDCGLGVCKTEEKYMKVLSLSQFLQQQGTESKELESQKVLLVTVRDFLDAIGDNYDDDWTAEVICDFPQRGGFSVTFKPAEEMEQ